jgi:hypothetical protein
LIERDYRGKRDYTGNRVALWLPLFRSRKGNIALYGPSAAPRIGFAPAIAVGIIRCAWRHPLNKLRFGFSQP